MYFKPLTLGLEKYNSCLNKRSKIRGNTGDAETTLPCHPLLISCPTRYRISVQRTGPSDTYINLKNRGKQTCAKEFGKPQYLPTKLYRASYSLA